MQIQTPHEIWQHPDRRIREFGLGLGGLGLCLGILRVAKQLGVRGLTHQVLSGQVASVWAIAHTFWLAGLIALVLFALVPGVMRPLYVVMTTVGMGIGFVVSRLVLTLTYITLFVVIGKWRRASSPIAKEFDKSAPSYWKKHAAGGASSTRYYRQF